MQTYSTMEDAHKKLKAMRQRRGEIADEARAITDLTPPISAADERRFSALMQESDSLKSQIDRLQAVNELDEHLAQKAPHFIIREQRASLEPKEVWSNTKTGEVISPLGKDERLADRVPTAMNSISLGDSVKAMLSPGSVGPDVRAALAEGTGSAGGYLVPESLSASVIDKMRAQAVTFRAGAKLIPMSAQTLHVARLDGDPTASWRGENQTVDESSPAFGRVTLTARSLATVIKVSRELVEDAPNLDAVLRSALAQAFALELDRAALFGVGAANEPMGVVNWTGIGEVSLGNNGGTLTSFDDFLTALFTLQNANAGDPTAAVLAPRTMLTINKMKDGEGLQLRRPDAIAGLPMLPTTSVPVSETQGSSNDCSSIILGDFGQLMVGVRTQLQIEVLRERFSDSLQYGLLAFLRADVAVAQPAAFVRIKGIKP